MCILFGECLIKSALFSIKAQYELLLHPLTIRQIIIFLLRNTKQFSFLYDLVFPVWIKQAALKS